MLQWVDSDAQWTDAEHQWQPEDAGTIVEVGTLSLSTGINSVSIAGFVTIATSSHSVTITRFAVTPSASVTIETAATSISIESHSVVAGASYTFPASTLTLSTSPLATTPVISFTAQLSRLSVALSVKEPYAFPTQSCEMGESPLTLASQSAEPVSIYEFPVGTVSLTLAMPRYVENQNLVQSPLALHVTPLAPTVSIRASQTVTVNQKKISTEKLRAWGIRILRQNGTAVETVHYAGTLGLTLSENTPAQSSDAGFVSESAASLTLSHDASTQASDFEHLADFTELTLAELPISSIQAEPTEVEVSSLSITQLPLFNVGASADATVEPITAELSITPLPIEEMHYDLTVSVGSLSLILTEHELLVSSGGIRYGEQIRLRSFIHPTLRMESYIHPLLELRSPIHPRIFLESLMELHSAVWNTTSSTSVGALGISLDALPVTIEVDSSIVDQTVTTLTHYLNLDTEPVLVTIPSSVDTSLIELGIVSDSVTVSTSESAEAGSFDLSVASMPPNVLSADTDIHVGSGSISVSGISASVGIGTNNTTLSHPIRLAQRPVTLRNDARISVGTVHISSAVQSITETSGSRVSVSLSALHVASRSMSVTSSTTLAASPHSVSASVLGASVKSGVTVPVGKSSVALSPKSVTVKTSPTVEVGFKAITISSKPIAGLVSESIEIFTGTHSVSMSQKAVSVKVGATIAGASHSLSSSVKAPIIHTDCTVSTLGHAVHPTVRSVTQRISTTVPTSSHALHPAPLPCTVTATTTRVDATIAVARKTITLAQNAVLADKVAIYLESQVYPTTGPQPDTFLVSFDGAANISVPATALTGGSVWLKYDVRGLSKGLHSARIIATNIWGWSQTSDPVTFLIV